MLGRVVYAEGGFEGLEQEQVLTNVVCVEAYSLVKETFLGVERLSCRGFLGCVGCDLPSRGGLCGRLQCLIEIDQLKVFADVGGELERLDKDTIS